MWRGCTGWITVGPLDAGADAEPTEGSSQLLCRHQTLAVPVPVPVPVLRR